MTDIDILRMPILTVASPRYTSELLERQVADLLVAVDGFSSVREARAALDAANAELEKLATRQASLNDKACELHRRLGNHRERLRDALIADRALTDAELQSAGTTKAESDGVAAALELLITVLIPESKRRVISADVAYLRARSAGILSVATARGQRIVEQAAILADADGAVEINLARVPTIGLLLSKMERLDELATQGRKQLDDTKG